MKAFIFCIVLNSLLGLGVSVSSGLDSATSGKIKLPDVIVSVLFNISTIILVIAGIRLLTLLK